MKMGVFFCFFYFFNRFRCCRRPAQIPVPGENTRTYSRSNRGSQDIPLEPESTSGADEAENNSNPEYNEIPDDAVIIPVKKNPGVGYNNEHYQSLYNGEKGRPHIYGSLNPNFEHSEV